MAKKEKQAETTTEEELMQAAQDLSEPEEVAELQASDMPENPEQLIEQTYQLWWNWADFAMYIINPTIEPISPPIIHEAEPIEGASEMEFVYPIHDYGYKLTTSKGEELMTAGKSNCKLFYTIEKMIYLLIERLKSGGIDTDQEVQVAFSGFELAQRKAFESVINLNHNVIVTNFDPGEWGDRYLEMVKKLADKGYGHPSETPRTQWKETPGASTAMKR